VTEPLELMGMQGHFGADVTLDKPGDYRFQVGSKLPTVPPASMNSAL